MKIVKRSLLFVLAPVAVLALLAVTAGTLVFGGDDARGGEGSQHSGAVRVDVRTVSLSTTMPMPSAHAQRLSAMLERGSMPTQPMMAEVMTDTDCTPDATMISRCRNVVRLADGSEIVLRHPHDMSNVPCLAPGERVRLLPHV